MTRTKALVRRPGPRLDEGLVTHIERTRVDPVRALAQWQGYVAVLADYGWQVVQVDPADDCPDAVFVEDTVVMFGDVAVLTRPGAPSRRPEVADVEAAVAGLGCSLQHIRGPGTLDGGDVLKVADTVYVGRGGRTNAAGVQQLAQLLAPLGARVVAVAVTKVLHLKSAVTALPDGTVIGFPPMVDDPGVYPRFMAVPEEHGSHVVQLGGPALLLSAAAPRTARLLADLGYQPVPVDISEFEALEGCVTCLSVRIRGLDG
jgi:dimethylargininase